MKLEEKIYYQYAKNILDETIISCNYIKLAANRFFDFLNNPEYEFRIQKVDKVIKFCSLLRQFTGQFNTLPLILEPWQQFAVANIFGFYNKETGRRITKNCYIEIARKNGKSTFAAALALYLLVADNEPNSEIELIANSSKQAGIVYSMCKNFSESLDKGKVKYFKQYRDQLRFHPNKGLLQILSSDAGLQDGWNSYAFIMDEVHEAKDSQLYDVLKSSQGMRQNPLAILLTTAGFNIGGFCYQVRNTNIEILKGLKQDPTQFTLIYTLDPDDDWKDESVWLKCSPNLGITVQLDYYHEQVQQAENNPSLEVGIKTKLFNLWLQTSKVWISDKYITDSMQELSYEDLAKHGSYCYQGIDLAAVGDLTAISTMVYDEKEKKYYFKTDYFVPQTALEEGTNNFIYTQWYKQGKLNVTPGNCTDFDYISKKQLEINKIIPVYQCAYDTWNSTQYVVDAQSYGLNMIPFSQTLGSFNRPTKEFERLCLTDRIVIDSNPITRWNFLNVSLKEDTYSNVKPVKGSSPENKIDGVISMLEALGLKIYQEAPDLSITFVQN